MSSKTTISDLAKHVGVSVTTVSHALSGKRKTGEELRKRILEAAKELNYRPSFAAQAMNTKRTMLVAALTDDCANASSGILFSALNSELEKRSYKMALGIAGSSKEKGLELLEAFSNGMVDGIINMMPQIDSFEALRVCGSVPTVTHLRQDSAPVYIDAPNAAIQALEHLWSLGHRKIGFIVCKTRNYGGEDPCLTGYKLFLSGKGEAFDESLCVPGESTIESGAFAASRLIDAGATAIFAGNDQMAVGVYQWAYRSNLKIPDELSVIGYDDSPMATALCPQLTSVQMPQRELARLTVESLMAKISGEAELSQPTTLRLPLILRKSTGAPRSSKT